MLGEPGKLCGAMGRARSPSGPLPQGPPVPLNEANAPPLPRPPPGEVMSPEPDPALEKIKVAMYTQYLAAQVGRVRLTFLSRHCLCWECLWRRRSAAFRFSRSERGV